MISLAARSGPPGGRDCGQPSFAHWARPPGEERSCPYCQEFGATPVQLCGAAHTPTLERPQVYVHGGQRLAVPVGGHSVHAGHGCLPGGACLVDVPLSGLASAACARLRAWMRRQAPGSRAAAAPA